MTMKEHKPLYALHAQNIEITFKSDTNYLSQLSHSLCEANIHSHTFFLTKIMDTLLLVSKS